MNLKDHIRDVPDFPKPGILFRDITPLLASHEAFLESVEKLAEPWQDTTMDAVAAVEARGFLFAGPRPISTRPCSRTPGRSSSTGSPTRTSHSEMAFTIAWVLPMPA